MTDAQVNQLDKLYRRWIAETDPTLKSEKMREYFQAMAVLEGLRERRERLGGRAD